MSKRVGTHTLERTGLANMSAAAEFLGVSRKTVRSLIDSGQLDHQMVGSHRRVTWESLYRFANPESKVSPAAATTSPAMKKHSKAAIADALRRIEVEIAEIRRLLGVR